MHEFFFLSFVNEDEWILLLRKILESDDEKVIDAK